MSERGPINRDHRLSVVKRLTQFTIESIRPKPSAQEIVGRNLATEDQFEVGEVVIVADNTGRYCTEDCDHQLATITSTPYFLDPDSIGHDLAKPGKNGYVKVTPGRLLFRDINGGWQKCTVNAIKKTDASDFIKFPI